MDLSPDQTGTIPASPSALSSARKHMGLFRRKSTTIPERRDTGSVPDDRYFTGTKFIMPEGDDSAATRVTPDSAMRFSAVHACVKVISETLASVPLILYQRRADGGKDRAVDHPLYRLLKSVPNAMKMSGLEFRETLTAHVLLWGNAYAQIVRNNRGEVLALYPLHPANVTVSYTPDRMGVVYTVQLQNGTQQKLSSEQILHVKGLCTNNPLVGQSPISAMRQAISMGMTLESYAANFFDGGAFPAGVLEYEGALEEQAKKNLRESWQKLFGGKNRGKNTAVLEMGVTWKGMGIPQTDAQFLETRRMQVEEIGRVFRVPMHLIGDLSHATYSNIEAQGQEFITYCMLPWFRRWEEAILRDLVAPDEQEDVFAEFLVDGLLRGDTTARFNAYSVAIQNGFFSRNEVRLRENLNPVEGADELLLPMNMAAATQAAEIAPDDQAVEDLVLASASTVPQTRTIDQNALMTAFRDIFREAFRRIISKEVNAVRAALKKHSAEDFDRWYTDFRENQAVFAENCLKTSFLAYSRLKSGEKPLDLRPYLRDLDDAIRQFRMSGLAEYDRPEHEVEYRAEQLLNYDEINYGTAA